MKEEWLAMRRLAEDCSIVIKPADKGSCVVVWDRTDYLLEVGKHLSDSNTETNRLNLVIMNLLN